jgi:hypothetical protein
LFADDTNVFYSHRSWQVLLDTLNKELSNIADWFCANRLTLNLDKTNFILFRSHRKSPPSEMPRLLVGNTLLAQVESTRFLGIEVDQHLTWKQHINNISSKLAKNIGILARTAFLLPPTVRLSLYYSLVYPYLTYCNMIWASNYPTRLNKLVVLQKRAVRVIAGICRGQHTSPFFYMYKLLRIEQIRCHQIGEFIYRLKNGLLPSVFDSYLQLGTDFHTYNTRNATAYRPIRTNSNTLYFTLKSSGIKVWNAIPPHIRNVCSLHIFKKLYRSFLLNM